MSKITLVTDFFEIGRGQDKNPELQRNEERYMKEFKRWARIRNKLIVYTDSRSADKIRTIRAEYGLEDKTIIIEINNLFELEANLYERMKKAASNPAFINFRYFTNASSNNPTYDYLWMMKYYFMNDAYERGLLSDNVVWIDFGFDHGGNVYYDENDYDFEWRYDFGDKIHIFCLYSPDSILGIQSLQFLNDCVLGSMYALPKKLVPEFWRLIRNAMEALLMLDCVDDDQHLVLMSYKARPEIFEVHITKWQMAMKICGADHMKARPENVQVENKYKRMLRLAIRKVIPNKNDLKKQFAKRCYDAAVHMHGK